MMAVFLAAFFVSGLQAQMDATKMSRLFEAAATKGDFKVQRKLVTENRGYCLAAVFGWEREYCKGRLGGNVDAAAVQLKLIKDLGDTYSIVYRDALVADRYKFISALTDDQLATRLDAIRFNSEGWNLFNGLEKSGDKEVARRAINQFTDSYNASNKITDNLCAGFDAEKIAQCAEKREEFFESAYWCKVAIYYHGLAKREDYAQGSETRLDDLKKKDRIRRPDLIDLSLDPEAAKEAHKAAYEESLKVKTTGSGASGGLQPPTSTAEYKWVDDTGFKPKNLPLRKKIWPPWFIGVTNHGNPQAFPLHMRFFLKKDAEAADLSFVLPGAKGKYDGKVFIDADGDSGKQKFKKIKLKLKDAKQKFAITYDDDTKIKLTMMMRKLPGSGKIFGVPVNYGDGSGINVVYFNTTGVTGKIRGREVTFIDGNSDGLYNGAGDDAVIIGKGKNQQIHPFGRYIFLEEESGLYPYRLKIQKKNACVVRTRPFNGELAPLRVEYSTGSGIMPNCLIAKGIGEQSSFFFDLMYAIDRPMWIPKGKYEIHRGLFVLDSKGEKTVLIGKGRSSTFEVKTGQMNTWKLGGTGDKGFWMLGKVEAGDKKGERIAVGKEVHVYGDFGEEYFNFLAERLSPTIELRKENGNGSKIASAEMKPHTGGGEFTIADLYHPKDTVLKNVPSSGKIVARWTANHGLLGKIKSEWTPIE